MSEHGHPEVKQVPSPKEPTSENLQAQFKHNVISSEILRWWVSTKACQCPVYFQLFYFYTLKLIEKF